MKNFHTRDKKFPHQRQTFSTPVWTVCVWWSLSSFFSTDPCWPIGERHLSPDAKVGSSNESTTGEETKDCMSATSTQTQSRYSPLNSHLQVRSRCSPLNSQLQVRSRCSPLRSQLQVRSRCSPLNSQVRSRYSPLTLTGQVKILTVKLTVTGQAKILTVKLTVTGQVKILTVKLTLTRSNVLFFNDNLFSEKLHFICSIFI